MAIFAAMLQFLKTFLNRPVAEEFSFKTQLWQSLQGGLYVFLFIYFLGGSSFLTGSGYSAVLVLALFGMGCAVSTLFANWVVPSLLPTIYDEDRWTVWKHILQTLFVLFCISVSNQILLLLIHSERPPFWQMYLMVTAIGFFPIIIGVFVTEQRRLRRNLAHAQRMNAQLATHRTESSVGNEAGQSIETTQPANVPSARIVLTSENRRDELSLQPSQLIYVESVGNYVEVHWLNVAQPQKTVLRNTLKDIAGELAGYPEFFRCHRAFLVNLNAVSQTEGNARGYQLTLTGAASPVPVSRSYLQAFDARIKAFG